jgi:hypothetical protein
LVLKYDSVVLLQLLLLGLLVYVDLETFAQKFD